MTDEVGWIFGLPMWLDITAFIFSLLAVASLILGLPFAIIWWSELKDKQP
jgi:hypothetical protein